MTSSGYGYTLALSDSGKLYAWGDNHSGQLGLGDTTSRTSPTKLDYNFGGKVVRVLCYAGASYVLTDTGKLYAWGNNEYGGLGIDSNWQNITNPTLVSTDNSVMASRKITGLSAYGNMAWSDDGSIFAWGNTGWSGQCYTPRLEYGDPAIDSCAIPSNITSWLNLSTITKNVKSVAFGGISVSSFNIVDNNTIKAMVPASHNLQPGKVDVTLTDTDNQTTTLTKGYEYIANKGNNDNTDDNTNQDNTNTDNNNQSTNPLINKDDSNHVIPTVPNTGL